MGRQTQTFNAVVNYLAYAKQYVEQNTPFLSELGLLKQNSEQIINFILPEIEKLQEKIQVEFPQEIFRRLQKLRIWIIRGRDKLKMRATEIESYIEQKHAVLLLEREFPIYKIILKNVQEMFETMLKNQIEIKKEHQAFFLETKNLELNLQTEIFTTSENI